MIKEENAFAIPIVKIRVKNWSEKKSQILDLVDWNDQECVFPHYYTDFFKNMQSETHPYMSTFDDILTPEINAFVQRVGRGVSVTELWAQRYCKSQSMPTHNHGSHGFSAVLYVEYDPEVHTPTVFYSPFGNFYDGQVTVYEPDVSEGDMVIFPSMLLHSSMPCEAKKNRTIFSFNMRFI